MLELKTKQKLADESFKLAGAFHLIRYHNTTYIPADCDTLETSVTPALDRTVWLPMSRLDLRRVASAQFNTLFSTDGELASFEFMVAQASLEIHETASSLLVRTPAGLRELNEMGQLVDVTGDFRPNHLLPQLNEKQEDKDRVFGVICDWLDSEEDAHSLLYHLATSLAPGWSAVKYVLLLGEGRNGKGVLLKMLRGIFGTHNISSVTRQAMAEASPSVLDLNGKLLNIVFDGRADYLKDSAIEKTLVAGEPAGIRKLYESTTTSVETNSLFIEGLNHEPKTKDKSPALQKRLVRFHFPRIYEQNNRFQRAMLAEDSLGAFLSLLIDHYVCEDDVAEKLAPTAKAIELQLEQMHSNSLGLQYLKWHEETDTLGVVGLLGSPMSSLVASFQSWRIKENDLGSWPEPDVIALFNPLLNTERKTQRVNGQPRKVRVITSFKFEANAFIESLKGGDDDAALLDALVDD